MRGISTSQRPALKSRLLIGAAGMAAAAMSTAAFAADAGTQPPAPDTWSPYASAGGTLGSGYAQGRVDLFVPAWQDLDSLLFVNVGVGTATRQDVFSGANIGYRTKVAPDWILGGHIGFDTSMTDQSHTVRQWTFGAEAMSADWDARINAYLANDSLQGNGKYELAIHDTSIGILQGQEAAYSGFDGEIGYRVFNTDNTDFRVFVGGFSFTHHSGFRYEDISGPMARAEINIFDLDELGPQSRITLQGEISHDSVRGTDGYVGANLRISLGDSSGSGAQALSDIDRRMVDPVRRRDNVLTASEFNKPEPVIIYGKNVRSHATNTLYYVDNSAGAGSYANPTTLTDAAKRGTGQNAFIVATDFDGTVVTGGAKLARGETLVGGGETFTVKGVESGATFTHDFAPGSGRPTLTSGAAATNVVNLSSDTAIYGLNIAGPFNDAIFGRDVTNVSIGQVKINGSAGGTNGIVIRERRSEDLNLDISDTAISNLSGDGIDIDTKVTDGGTSTHNISLDHVGISGIGGYAVNISTYAGAANTSLDQTIDFHNVKASSDGAVGVQITGFAGAGADLSQDISIDPTVISGAYYGLLIGAQANSGAHVHQDVSVDGLHANGLLADIFAYGEAAGGGVLHQSFALNDVVASNSAFGVSISGYAGAGGRVLQTISADKLHADNNYFYGLSVTGIANGTYGSSLLAQYVSIENSAFKGNGFGGAGISLTTVGDAAGLQQVDIRHSTFDGNGGGLAISESAYYGSSAQQNVLLLNDEIVGNAYNGAVFAAYGLYGGFAAQSVTIYGNAHKAFEISGNGATGVTLRGWALGGGNVEQNGNIYYADLSHNGGDGLYVDTLAYGGTGGTYANYYSQVTSNVIAVYDTFSHNGANGVHVDNLTKFGGQLNQFVEVYGSVANKNGKDGVFAHSVADSYDLTGGYVLKTQLYSDIYVINTNASNNGRDGIAIDSAGYSPIATVYAPTYMIQHAVVQGVTAHNNHRDGLEVSTYAAGYYGFNLQYVTVSGSSFTANRDGALFISTEYYGPGGFGAALQDITIQNSSFSNNRRSGMYALTEAFGNQGRAEQNINIFSSTFDNNGAAGLVLERYAHDGVPVAGYYCDDVQGLAGGCAFVRQVVQIQDSDFSHNGFDGIAVLTNAEGYGAVYSAGGHVVEPTLLLSGVTANYNGGDGLYVQNIAGFGSYISQYIVAIDSHFDHNTGSGIYSKSTSGFGSVIVQNIVLYGSYAGAASASDNGAHGVYSKSLAVFGAYAASELIVQNADVSDNVRYGVSLYNAAYLGSASRGILAAYGNTISGNYAGINMEADGTTLQTDYIGGNLISGNLFGAGAFANGGAIQVVNLYYYHGDTSQPMGNTFSGNGTDFVHINTGSTQIIY